MDTVIDFAKLLVPAGLVLYAMYLVVKTFLAKDFEKRVVELRTKNQETVLPIRLQAYERMTLFLERISPNNLIPRVKTGGLNSREFQHVLLNEIRTEFNHNVSQQIYMSHEAWELIKNAKEDLIVSINNSADELSDESSDLELSRKIFGVTMNSEHDAIGKAIKFLKEEIQQYF